MTTVAKPNDERARAMAVYDEIRDDYIAQLEDAGVDLQTPDESRRAAGEVARLVGELVSRGVAFRNAGASVSWRFLSSACAACTGRCGSKTYYLSLKCNRNCYFCFNPNQQDFERWTCEKYPWKEDLLAQRERGEDLACIGLTGGEPLLFASDAVHFFETARALYPKAHLRLYTAGDLLTDDLAVELSAAGLDEIRFSVKTDDPSDVIDRVIGNMAIAKRHIPTVMVEMPAVPGTDALMESLLRRFDEARVDGINLLEFCFPFNNWAEFEKRGFKVKNPPFEVFYDYDYAGSLPIAGSEELCLQLMLFAIDKGLDLGVHYCSLENKHRMEMRQVNEPGAFLDPNYEFDGQDFFLKTAKVYGKDVPRAKELLAGCRYTRWREDTAERSLSFPPSKCRRLARAGLQPVVSYNVLVEQGGKRAFRELALLAYCDD